uniref:Uncharacterized protein n=1 Tax=Anguilla anguilla TaxID=7936 RepID=A0A0E9SMH7_ANGAN
MKIPTLKAVEQTFDC